jgi:hypothetical protein
VAINPSRGTVNTNVYFNVTGFPHNAPIQISWRRLSGSVYDFPGPYFTNNNGSLTGTLKVPATPGGPGQLVTFRSGNVSRTVAFEVAPRIKVNTNPAVRGQLADVSLRGYAKNESVRIRWKKGSSWVTLATVTTSNTGSANVNVRVPTWAPNGLNSVRGDGTHFRQQTNVVKVQGGPVATTGVSAATVGQTPSGLPRELIALAIPAISLGFVAGRRRRKLAIS